MSKFFYLRRRYLGRYLFVTVLFFIILLWIGLSRPAYSTRIGILTTSLVSDANQSADWERDLERSRPPNRSDMPVGHDDAWVYQELARLRAESPETIFGETQLTGSLALQAAGREEVGEWSTPEDWPVHATHSALMPDNTIVSWHNFKKGFDVYRIDTGQHETTKRWAGSIDTILFCAAFSHFPDGRLLTGGGNSNTANQTKVGLIYDSADQQFRETDDLEYPRYYASAATLGNGDIMIFGGNWADKDTPDYPEIYNLQSGWRTLDDVDQPISHNQYHWVQQAPNGDVIYVGPGKDIAYIDTIGDGRWTEIERRDSLYRSYGSYAMYDVGRILVGGGPGAVDDTSDRSAYTIDFYENSDDVDVSRTANMVYTRRQSMMVVLADGSILALGGNSSGSFTDWPNGVLPTEIWDPASKTWTETAPMAHSRQYHGSSLLLPDGRVFAAGGGNDAGGGSEDYLDAEFFSPPYLFDEDGNLAERPEIDSVQEFINHGDTLLIETDSADEIEKIHLIKLGSSTHSQDMSQRLVPLNFTTVEDQIEAVVPANPNIVVPGYYLLFILNGQGVPSVAKYVNVGGQTNLVLNTPGNQHNYLGDLVDVTLTAYNPNDGDLTYAAENLPPGLNLDAESGQIGGTVTAEGRFTVLLQVDAGDESSELEITWVVEIPEGPLNTPPLITIPDSQIHKIGESVIFQLIATDAEDHTLTYRADGLPDGLSIDAETGLISGIPTRADLYFPNISVTDELDGVAGTQFGWRIENADLEIMPIKTTPIEVNEPITYSIIASGWSGLQYRWRVGENGSPNDFTSQNTFTYTFDQPGRHLIHVTLKNRAGSIESYEFVQIVYSTPTKNEPKVSTGIMTIKNDGREEVWNVNPDNDSVTVFDLESGLRLAEIPVGRNPRALAKAPNGDVWVVNKKSASISIIDSGRYMVYDTVPLPYASQPHGLIIDIYGAVAYLSLEGRGEVVQLGLSRGRIQNRLPLGSHIRHLSLDADGETLFVSRFISAPLDGEGTTDVDTSSGGGEIFLVDTASFTLSRTVQLHYSNVVDTDHSGSGLPNYLGPLIISPDGRYGYVPSKQDNITRGQLRNETDLDHDNTVRSISSYIDLVTQTELSGFRIDHDDAAMPVNGLFDQNGTYFFALMEGSQEIRVIDVFSNQEHTSFTTGLAPQHLTLSGDGQTLIVHNFLERTVSGFDISQIIEQDGTETIQSFQYSTVSNERLSPAELRGKQIFYEGRDPRLSLAPYMTCATCHADGGHDGRTWDMSGLGEGLRNTPSLVGRAGTGHGPLHWSGNFDEIHDFENQIRALAQGSGLMSDEEFAMTEDPLGFSKAGYSSDLDALATYMASFDQFDGSPWSPGEGLFSPEAEAGKLLFEQIGCASCHVGPAYTDSPTGLLHDIGTLKLSSGSRLGDPLPGIDTPTLLDVWQTGPYLHDGSASSLQEAIAAHDLVTLSETELDQLAQFLMELGGPVSETETEPTATPQISPTPVGTPSPTATPVMTPVPSPQAPSRCGLMSQCVYLPLVFE